MFPKVVWTHVMVSRVLDKNRTSYVYPPAAYGHLSEIIILNTIEFVKPKGIYLVYVLFHEFLHHLNNFFDLPLFFDYILDILDKINFPSASEDIYSEDAIFHWD